MSNYGEAFEAIKESVQQLNQVLDTVLEQYTEMVNSVLDGRLTNERDIERIMDGLVDFGDDARFREIYRKLCRHVYYQYPQLVGEHVALFRLQFETTEEDRDCQEEAHQGDMTM